MEEYFRSKFLGILEDSVSLLDLGQKLENLESRSLFRRWRRRWRCFRFSFSVDTTAGSNFRRGGPRWSSGTGDLNCHGKGAQGIQILIGFPNTTIKLWAYFCLGLPHSKPNATPYHPNSSVAPLAGKKLFSIGLWQLRSMHLDYVLLSFSCIQIRPAPLVLQRPTLFYLLFVLLIR